MLVVKAVEGGIVRRVVLLDDAVVEVVLVTRFLGHWLIPGIARYVVRLGTTTRGLSPLGGRAAGSVLGRDLGEEVLPGRGP